MVNYTNSKIISVGDTVSCKSIFATTVNVKEFLKGARKNFIKYQNFQVGYNPIFDILEKNSNPYISVLVEASLQKKNELNKLLEETKKKFMTHRDIIDTNTTGISESTASRYSGNISIIIKLLFIADIGDFIKKPFDIINSIMSLDKSLNTKKNYIKAIIAFIHNKQKTAREIYSASLASIQDEINKKIDKQEKNEGVVYRTPEELNEITDEFLENGEIQNALLSVFYTGFYMPVCRVKEIYTLKIRNYNINNDNYIDLIDKCFVFNDFKTSKIYGKQKVLFNDFIYNLIEQLADTHDKDFLFINNKKEPYSQTDMSTKIKNKIGYSVNDLRSMYFTHHSQLGNLNTEIQKQKFAVLMRNSPSVFKYYIKY